MEMVETKTLIIGAGPAGISAAIELAHLGEEFIIIEKGEIGGLALNAFRVKNYPGIPSITGRELALLFKSHLRQAGIKVTKDEALKVRYQDGSLITTAKRRCYASKFLILATGTSPKIPNIEISKSAAKQISYEIKGLLSLANKEVAVIGGGDVAFDYALSLAKKNTVHIFFRNNRPRCNPWLIGEARKMGVTLVGNANTKKIFKEGKKVFVELDGKTKAVDRVVIAVGRYPLLDVIDKDMYSTGAGPDIHGLYIIGDAARGEGSKRQIGMAVGDGICAALDIYYKGLHGA
jgi:thioredoxin reductase (NADPH)